MERICCVGELAMTDQTKCPHCGAETTFKTLLQVIYQCGSRVMDGHFHQSMTCETLALRAKVAAQQELLREVIACGCSWRCDGTYAELQVPLDLITNIRKAVEE